MSKKGDCYDNTMMESFFHTLKSECVYREYYKTRDLAKKSIFEYIEMFYNPKRKHTNNGLLSLVEFERQQKLKSQGV